MYSPLNGTGLKPVTRTLQEIEGLCVIEPAVHGDARGYFMETYNEKDMKEAGMKTTLLAVIDAARNVPAIGHLL